MKKDCKHQWAIMGGNGETRATCIECDADISMVAYKQICDLLAENSRLREALEYYACKESYYIPCDGSTGGLTVIDADEGSIASAALEEK